jgi:hypothetical protein
MGIGSKVPPAAPLEIFHFLVGELGRFYGIQSFTGAGILKVFVSLLLNSTEA